MINLTMKSLVANIITCSMVCAVAYAANNNDCQYLQGLGNESCPAEEAYIRTVDCASGQEVTVCCVPAANQEYIQAARQVWFRAVTLIGNLLSFSCTEQILCEQSCQDGLLHEPAVRHFPTVLPNDSDHNVAYVHAWQYGEELTCFGLNGPSDDNTSANRAQCKAECGAEYPTCAGEMRHSWLLQLYYRIARPLHRLGLVSFAVLHPSLDEDQWVIGIDELEAFYNTLAKIVNHFAEVLSESTELRQLFLDSLQLGDGYRLAKQLFSYF